MSIEAHLKVVGAVLIALGLAHSLFGRYFRWKEELAQVSLLTQQIFFVHCFFVSLSLVLIGGCSLLFTPALLRSGALSRVVLAGLVVFWLARLVCQLFVYDAAIWRGHRFYTFMHAAFSVLWLYIAVVYGAALKVAFA